MKKIIITVILSIVVLLNISEFKVNATEITKTPTKEETLSKEKIEEYKKKITARYNIEIDKLYADYDKLKEEINTNYAKLQELKDKDNESAKKEVLKVMEDLKVKLENLSTLITKQTDLYNEVIDDLNSNIEIKEELLNQKMKELFEEEIAINENKDVNATPTITIVEIKEVEITNVKEVVTIATLILSLIAIIVVIIVAIKVKVAKRNSELRIIEQNKIARKNSESEVLKEITNKHENSNQVNESDIDDLF